MSKDEFQWPKMVDNAIDDAEYTVGNGYSTILAYMADLALVNADAEEQLHGGEVTRLAKKWTKLGDDIRKLADRATELEVQS